MRGLDPVLAAVLLAATLFCLRGIGWGRVEPWNRDQMALRELQGLRPTAFLKPPFHTYLNHFFVLLPVQAAETMGERVTGKAQQWNHARLIGSRLLVLVLFLGTIVFGYVVSLRFYGEFAARVAALFLGTSAGFIVYAHFLSCDSPLLFFLLATLFFAQRIVQRGETSDYVWAGLCAGLATATKYNGLAVGILIPVAHLLSRHNTSRLRALFDPRLFLGVAMVPAGFLLGNPYAMIEWRRFLADFMYNYETTPVYGGQHGTGYGAFLRRFREVLGWPGSSALWVLIAGSLAVVIRPRWRERASAAGFLLIVSFFLLYYLKIGSFARMPTRFVLPAVPFFILLAGPALAALHPWRRIIYALLAPILCYNVVCAVVAGERFATDPRLAAQSWMIAHLLPGQTVESSGRSPHWAKLPELKMLELNEDDPARKRVRRGRSVDLRMPVMNGRAELFSRVLKGNPWVATAPRREGEPDEQVFTRAALRARHPDFVTVDSEDATMPSEMAQRYYAEMVANRFPYAVQFDRSVAPLSRFVYPRSIDFIGNRITILQRLPAGPAE